MGVLVNATPGPLYLGERNPASIVQEAGSAPGPVWTCAEISPLVGCDPRTIQPVASYCTDYAILARKSGIPYIYEPLYYIKTYYLIFWDVEYFHISWNPVER